MTNILPAYLAIGVSEEEFWDSTPCDLKPYVTAYKLNMKARDTEAWRNGMYIMNAFSTVLANCFNKKSKAKYFEQPLLSREDVISDREPTEEEKKIEREKLLATLMIMQDNFERNNK